MKFIVRDTDYAIRSLIFMARIVRKKTKDVITVDDIVEKLDLPERFLRRILQKLAVKGVLMSHKGKKGGFSFRRPPGQIKITDIIEIFHGKVDLTNCLLKGERCPDVKDCPFRKKLKEIGRLVDRELGKITIASLLRET